MQLYNTLTRTKETVTPLNAPEVTVYTCGPTVYDYAHIGHWFTNVRWDMLIRTLKLSGLTPKWVMNITDVGHLVSDADDGEDKLEKGARREGKTAWEVAEFYTADFLEGMQLLNITAPDFLTKATEHIPEQIALIQALESKGYTYIIDDGVYFDTSMFEGYASFAGLDLEDLQAGARVEYNKQKKNPSDFALWKFSPKDHQRDMEWESPWGIGFPGWHIECSAMAMNYLGETLDIHAGGIDHIQVHHTNEIAQSEAVTGKRFANVWLHSNHVSVNGEKISKSLGNGIRVQELIEQGFSADSIRLHILESNYSSQSKFSLENLESAKNRLTNYRTMAAHAWQPSASDDAVSVETVQTTQQAILAALQDDLNTPKALALLSQLEGAIDTSGISTPCQEVFVNLLDWLESALGVSFAVPDISAEQKTLLQDRETARQQKDWATSDALRDALSEQGIQIKDTPAGVVWSWS